MYYTGHPVPVLIVVVFQANVVLSKEFARRYGDKGIVAFSLNPGQEPFTNFE